MEKTTEEHELQLKLHTTTEFESFSLNASEEFFVLGSVETPKFELKARAPVEVVAVVDVSGSMAGEKLSLVRSTLQFLSHQFQSIDKFSLVTYDSNVNVLLPLTLMTKNTKDSLSKYIDNLKEGSNTNLSGGLLKGLEQFSAERAPNTVATVLLMTDGLANEGITDMNNLVAELKSRREKSANSASVFTFGFGKNHEENMLRAIAENAGGMYYFIENLDSIAESYGDCLGGLLSVVAQNIKLAIKPVGEVKISRVLGKFKFVQ